ncbi:hypothetical protein P7K49_014915 [Saguinus oedipus]|uniref:A to I editase domain-containing protein n=1 Tax=Saguinus oedipus TaxID=9490 RepID=A0ABQ9V7R7_SAGOE|nr:hypothetical protein P7K49_014915 [Saguinus oedipus]
MHKLQGNGRHPERCLSPPWSGRESLGRAVTRDGLGHAEASLPSSQNAVFPRVPNPEKLLRWDPEKTEEGEAQPPGAVSRAALTLSVSPGLDARQAQVVVLSSGTKCISGEHLSDQGLVVNDCHAEVVARRAFLHFLYTQLELHLR